MENITTIQPSELADIIRCKSEKVLIVDARTFCEFNTSHIINAVNVWSSKIRKKRLQQNSITVQDFLHQACHLGLQETNLEEAVVYDQSAMDPATIPKDTFLHVLLTKLASSFSRVLLLKGGFLEFQSQFHEMCEDSTQKSFLLTSFSQPCLPVSTAGPTKILPFLFLGSQYDANNKQLLLEHNISFELNVSTTCPKPDFMQDSHFLRIPVNDNFSAKLLPHFEEAFRFIDKVREVSGRVLVHCLAGISRSPTVVISYVMKYLRLHYDEAYRYVKTRRPTISPNINFVGQLLELDLHLFGDRVLFRSSPGSVSLECVGGSGGGGGDLAHHNTGSPFLLKSSSSSCLKSCSVEPESAFPYHLNRSMPSLRLNKSVDESDKHSTTSGYNFTPRAYSDRLPSSPVSRPTSPVSPEFVLSVTCPVYERPAQSGIYRTSSKMDSEVLNGRARKLSDSGSCKTSAHNVKISSPGVSIPHTPKSTTPGSSVPLTPKSSTPGASIPVTPNSSNLGASIPLTPKSSTPRASIPLAPKSSTPGASIPLTPKCSSPGVTSSIPVTPKRRVRVLERTSFVDGDSPPDRKNSVVTLKDSAIPKDQEVEKERGQLPLQESKREVFSFPPKAQQRGGNPAHPLKRAEPVNQLPRSYSSSETYLNTRCRLERQAAAAGRGNHARKSYSSDEVGRGFQERTGAPPDGRSNQGQTVPGSVYMRDHETTQLELARTDSWSTSGLGSEISDWDSLQGDPTQPGAPCDYLQGVGGSIDDAQGPFDAVFSDVFPGDGQNSIFKETAKRQNSSCEQIPTKDASKGELEVTDEAAGPPKNAPAEEEPSASGACPTPRPVSLPGVSGTYKLSDSSANADMGVDLDSGEWLKDVDPFDFSPHTGGRAGSCPTSCGRGSSCSTYCRRGTSCPTSCEGGTFSLPRKGPIVKQKRLEIVEVDDLIGKAKVASGVAKAPTAVEHPPVSPRTMGENVKYIMTWYKIDSSSQDASSIPVEPASPKNSVKWASERLRTPSPIDISEPHITESDASESVSSPTDDLLLGGEGATLHDRWQWWDNEFKKKIRNIKKNVSLTHWDPSSIEEWEGADEGGATERVAGYHLAQELMQSMEDLLEKEISDIKRQASALSTRFGLPVTGKQSPPVTDLPSPGLGPTWRVNNSPFHKTETGFYEDENIERQESYSLPYEFTGDSDGGFGVTVGAGIRPFVTLRAKSEPPNGEECLYRVKSCPGISETQGDTGASKPPLLEAKMYPPLMVGGLIPPKHEGNKRYSCSALDFFPHVRPSFESCPDMSQLRAPVGGGTRSSAGGGSPSASFTRLLRVS